MDAQLAQALAGGPDGPRRVVATRLCAWSGLSYDWRAQVVASGGDSLAAVLETLAQPGEEIVTILPSDAALRRRWHRRTKAVVVPWLAAAGSSVWTAIAIACLRADAWLVLDARGASFDQPAGSHPAALPGMARRTITVGSMCAGHGWIAGPRRIVPAVAQTRHVLPAPLPVAS